MPKKLATRSAPALTHSAREDHPARNARRAHDKSSSRPNGRAPTEPRLPRRPEKIPPRRKSRTAIDLATASDVLAALRHAEHVGLLPNRHLTINLEAAGIGDPIVGIGKLMKLMRDGCRRHGHAFSYIWVREVGPIVGEHVHILLHVPRSLSTWFARRKPGWLKRIGARRGRGISHTRVIRGAQIAPGISLGSPDLLKKNLQNITGYVLKHCSADVQRQLGILSAGPLDVVGKRVSISENLHRRARKGCSLCTA